MTLMERMSGLVTKVKGVVLGEDAPEESQVEANLANGGHSGYRPSRAKGQDVFATGTMQPVGTGAQQTPAAAPAGLTQQGYPQAAYAGAPAGYDGFQQPPSWSGSAQASAIWQQTPQQGYQQPQQPAYDTGFGQQAWQQPQQTAMQPPAQQPQAQDRRRKRDLPAREPAQQTSNVTLFPGSFVDQNGNAYVHVERIAQLVSVSACFRIIEFMRNGESVIVNTESIASDADVQRCLDMLSGAAFTLGCTLTRITQVRRAYLIAPSSVMVMEDAAMSRWSDNDRPKMDASSSYAEPDRSRTSRRRAYATETVTPYAQ